MGEILINPKALKTGREITRFRLAYGTSIYRILPPTESSDGYHFKWFPITWGLLDPKKGTRRPYVSASFLGEDCPIKEYLGLATKKLEDWRRNLKDAKVEDQEIKDKTLGLATFINSLKIKSWFLYNAIDKSGKTGILEISTKSHKELKNLMGEYINKYSQDPTSLGSDAKDSGVWFKFDKIKTGPRMIDTDYKVDFNKIPVQVEGEILEKLDRSPISADVAVNYKKYAYNLSDAFNVVSTAELKTVLIANLKLISKTVPEVLVPGFDDIANAVSIVVADKKKAVTQNTTENKPVESPAPEVKTAAPAAASKITIKLDDPAEVIEEDEVDVFAMADSILGKSK